MYLHIPPVSTTHLEDSGLTFLLMVESYADSADGIILGIVM